jgi:hypothetical protein
MDDVRMVDLAEQSQFAGDGGKDALVFSGDAGLLDTQLLIRIVGTRRKSDLTVGATANTGSESEAVAEGFVRRASHRNERLDGREFGSNGIVREFDGKQMKMRDLIQIGDGNTQLLKDGMRSS